MYLTIIYGLYTKRNGKGRKLTTLLIIIYRTLTLGRTLYIPIVMLLYGGFYTRALIGSTRYSRKEIRLTKLVVVLGGLI